MDEWKRTSAARSQMYHLLVQWRQLKGDLPRRNRTAHLHQALEMVDTLLRSCVDAYDAGEILELQLNHYVQQSFAIFDEDGHKIEKSPSIDED